MSRCLAVLALMFSTTAWAQEVGPPDHAPAAASPTSAVKSGPALRPLARGDTRRYRLPRGPIPEGYHLVEEPRYDMAAGGVICFALGWAASVLYAVQNQNPLYAVPFGGPVIAWLDALRGGSWGGQFVAIYLGAPIMFIDVSAQVAGVVMLLVGLAGRSRWLERDEPAAPRVMLVPGAGSSPMGASLVGRF
jgi:hypothetical protein